MPRGDDFTSYRPMDVFVSLAMEFSDVDREEFREMLAEIGNTYMPFGRYGADHFPPHGVPVMDLPEEYLQWFRQRGFPPNRLGELLEIALEIKEVGMDSVFEPIRQARGGRMSIRKGRGNG